MSERQFETIVAGLDIEIASEDERLIEAAKLFDGVSQDIATYHAFLKNMNDVCRRFWITEDQAFQALALARRRMGETNVTS